MVVQEEGYIDTCSNGSRPFPIILRQPVTNPWSKENVQAAVDSWGLTNDEVAKFRDLQHRLSDIQHWRNEPITVLRFMFAPTGYKAAEGKFRDMIQWRRRNKIDTILEDYVPPQVLLEQTPTTILQDYDRDGDPIILERGGAVDVNLTKEVPREGLVRHGIWLRELFSRGVWNEEYQQRLKGRRVKYYTLIYDLEGLSSKHMDPQALGIFREVVTISKEYYPVKVKRVIVVRAPPMFRFLWNIIKHFFRQSIRDKIIFAGKHYLEVLDQYMERRVLPECIAEGGCGRSANGLPPIVGSNTKKNKRICKPEHNLLRDSLSSLSSCSNGTSPDSGTVVPVADLVSEMTPDGTCDSSNPTTSSSSASATTNVSGLLLATGYWVEEYTEIEHVPLL